MVIVGKGYGACDEYLKIILVVGAHFSRALNIKEFSVAIFSELG